MSTTTVATRKTTTHRSPKPSRKEQTIPEPAIRLTKFQRSVLRYMKSNHPKATFVEATEVGPHILILFWIDPMRGGCCCHNTTFTNPIKVTSICHMNMISHSAHGLAILNHTSSRKAGIGIDTIVQYVDVCLRHKDSPDESPAKIHKVRQLNLGIPENTLFRDIPYRQTRR